MCVPFAGQWKVVHMSHRKQRQATSAEKLLQARKMHSKVETIIIIDKSARNELVMLLKFWEHWKKTQKET